MDLMEAIKKRHSVRSYTDKKIEGEVLNELGQMISQCNKDGSLNMQLCLDDSKGFSGMMARFGRFNNVRNYIALVGKDDSSLDEKCGYYGQKIVLKAQQLGLNSCWVSMTFNKRKTKKAVTINKDEKLLMVIAIGYGKTDGESHKVKSIEELSNIDENTPEYFRRGMEAVQLAPTGMNKQKFRFELDGDKVNASSDSGSNEKVGLGIVKYHYEIGSGKSIWNNDF